MKKISLFVAALLLFSTTVSGAQIKSKLHQTGAAGQETTLDTTDHQEEDIHTTLPTKERAKKITVLKDKKE